MTGATARASLRDAVNELRREVTAVRERLDALAAEIHEQPARGSAQDEEADGADRGRVELDWLSAHIEEIAAKHRGEAIAISGQRVVASGPDLETVVRLASEAGHPDALFTGIPKDRPRPRI